MFLKGEDGRVAERGPPRADEDPDEAERPEISAVVARRGAGPLEELSVGNCLVRYEERR